AAVVARGHPGAAYLDLADALAIPRDGLAGIHIGEAELDTGNRESRLEPDLPAIGLRHVALHRSDRRDRRGLGHPPSLVGIDAMAGQAVVEAGGEGRSADEHPEPIEIGPGLVQVLEQGDPDAWGAGD